MANEPIVRGSTAAAEQPGKVVQWSRDDYSETRYYEGPHAAIDNLFVQKVNENTHERVTQEYFVGYSRLTVEDVLASPTGVIDERWELDTNIIRRALSSHPNLDGVDKLCMIDVETAIKKQTPWPDIPWNTPGCLATWETELKQYYFHRMAGVRSYLYVAYVLRHVQITKRTATVTASHSGVGTVQPLPSGVPTILIGPLPSDIEWLKQPPKLRGTGDKHYELSQEYWGGTPLWSNWLYGGTWDPSVGG